MQELLMSKGEVLETQSIVELAASLKSGELSPVTLVEQTLQRIEKLNPRLNAFNTVTAEQAMVQARAAEKELAAGQCRGPLHGIPIGLKDLLKTKGTRTTVSSKILADWVPDADATVVQRLAQAGAVFVGKTNMTEFALSGYHQELESPVNPWGAESWPGVSSSGSGVAVAARLCHGAVGSDTGGSIRIPCAVNGVVGIKPTYGWVSRHGAFPLSESLDHIGPMTNCVEDAAVMLGVMAGFDIDDPTSLDLPAPDFRAGIGRGAAGVRVGIDSSYNSQVDPEVGAALAKVADILAAQGAEVVDIDLTGIEEGAEHWFTLTGVEALNDHRDHYPARADEYGPVFRSLLAYAETCSGAEVSRAYTARGRVGQVMRRVFTSVDLVLCPSFAGPPPTLEEFPPQMVLPPEAVPSIVLYQAPFNFSGSPTISLPMGFSSSGLPLSLQLVGRHCEEALLVQVAHAYEQATEWHHQIAPGAQL
jgi:amidase